MECSIRVGRVINGQRPIYPDFTEIYSLTKSTPYGDLSPYCLKNSEGVILENLWQFSKLYQWVPKTIQTYSRWDSRIIWNHSEEIHVIKDNSGKIKIQLEYWNWRRKGFQANDAIRYPVGFHHRQNCLAVILDGKPLNYIDSRKKLYLPAYLEAVTHRTTLSPKQHPTFLKLKRRLNEGEKLLITEIDGPHQESLYYYQEKYGIDETFIERNSMEASKYNLEIMLNDNKHPFGHGYCLAWALLGY